MKRILWPVAATVLSPIPSLRASAIVRREGTAMLFGVALKMRYDSEGVKSALGSC